MFARAFLRVDFIYNIKKFFPYSYAPIFSKNTIIAWLLKNKKKKKKKKKKKIT